MRVIEFISLPRLRQFMSADMDLAPFSSRLRLLYVAASSRDNADVLVEVYGNDYPIYVAFMTYDTTLLL